MLWDRSLVPKGIVVEGRKGPKARAWELDVQYSQGEQSSPPKAGKWVKPRAMIKA